MIARMRDMKIRWLSYNSHMMIARIKMRELKKRLLRYDLPIMIASTGIIHSAASILIFGMGRNIIIDESTYDFQ